MKLNYSIFFVLFYLLSFYNVSAQNNIEQQKDSLSKVITKTEGEEKLKAYQRLTSYYYKPSQIDTVLALYDEMYAEAELQENLTYQGLAKLNTLVYLLNCGIYDEVVKLAPECLKLLAEKENWRYYYQAYQTLFKVYLYKGELETALNMATQIYEEANKQHNDEGVAIALYCMSDVYSKQLRYEESEVAIRQCIELLKDNEPLVHISASAYNRLCQSLLRQENFTELLQATREFEKVNQRYEVFAKAPVPSTWANLWMIYMQTYMKTGEYDEAEIYADKIDSIMNNTGSKIIVYKAKAQIYNSRGQYKEALQWADMALELIPVGDASSVNSIRGIKMMILSEMGDAKELYRLAQEAATVHDSLRNLEFSAKVDELRTQYELDKHIVEKEQARIEKERNRNYFLFALGGCILLIVLLIIWIHYSRLVTKKNRVLVSQIKALQVEQEQRDNEVLNKTTFESEEHKLEDDFCPESRKDKLCIAIRDMLLKDKIYREPTINRDYMLERLAISRWAFDDAVQHCFEMSFPEYINYLRMKDALALLEQSDLSIEIIAEKVGYGSVRTFQRQFQNKYNMSPKEYRKLTKGNGD